MLTLLKCQHLITFVYSFGLVYLPFYQLVFEIYDLGLQDIDLLLNLDLFRLHHNNTRAHARYFFICKLPEPII